MPIGGFIKDWREELGFASQIKLEEELEAARTSTETTESYDNISVDRLEIIENARNSLDFLAMLAMPDIYAETFPHVHQAAWKLLLNSSNVLQDFPQIALGIPRGHAKTTLIKLFILYCILYVKEINFPLIVCETEQKATNILADVIEMLDHPNIISIYGDWKLGDLKTDRKDFKQFGFRGRTIVFIAMGAGGSLRGLNIAHLRPNLIVFDDIQSKEASESQTISDSLMRWLIGTAMKSKSPKGCLFVFIANMYPGPNSILKKLKSNPGWTKFISGAILADGTALWPKLRSLPSLIQELDNDISMGHPEIFFSEVLNDTDAGINTRVDLDKIKQWPWSEYEQPQGKFIIVDPSNNKYGGDDVGIGYFEVYDGIPALREVIEEKLSPGNQVRQALLMALQHKCKLIAVESTAFQYTLLYWFSEISRQLQITGIEFVEVYTGNFSKSARITEMLKALTQGEMIIHPTVYSKVVSQISNWNPLKRDNVDNILDLLSYAPRVVELYAASIYTSEELVLLLENHGGGVQEQNSAF